MGISRLTALQIQDGGESILCQAGGPDPETGKYSGWISVNQGHRGPRPLLNTQPIYNSEMEAEAAMKRIVEDVRATNLMP